MIALCIIALRIGGSAMQPTPGMSADVISYKFQGEDREEASAWCVDWRACVVGHFCDAVVLMSLGAFLIDIGRVGWGALVALVSITELSVTLLRVAAVQGGVVLRRLYLERVLRNGALLSALGMAAVWGPQATWGGVPLIALGAVGGAVFAAVELARVLYTSEAASRIDDMSTVDEMVWRRMANLLPIVERSAEAEIAVAQGAAADSGERRKRVVV